MPIDTVAFDFAILRPDEERKATAEKIPDGSVCHGLFFEGARWDVEKHVIAESRPRELYTTCPMFHMQPKVKGDIEEVIGRPELYTGAIQGTAHKYQVPVYRESARAGVLSTTGHSTNFVMFIRVPMAKEHTQPPGSSAAWRCCRSWTTVPQQKIRPKIRDIEGGATTLATSQGPREATLNRLGEFPPLIALAGYWLVIGSDFFFFGSKTKAATISDETIEASIMTLLH